MGSTLFRDPQARSSALAALGTPQPRAFGSLNRVDPLDSASNLYLVSIAKTLYGYINNSYTPYHVSSRLSVVVFSSNGRAASSTNTFLQA